MYKDKIPECKFRNNARGIEVFSSFGNFCVSICDSRYYGYILGESKRQKMLKEIEQATSEMAKDLAYLKFSGGKDENDEYNILQSVLKKFIENYKLEIEKEGRTSYGDYLYTVAGVTFRTTFKMQKSN
jgi:hypothetical protein